MVSGETAEAAQGLLNAASSQCDPAVLDAGAAKARIAALDTPPHLDLMAHARAAAAAGRRPVELLRELGQAMRGPRDG
jgi:hypothetical protein